MFVLRSRLTVGVAACARAVTSAEVAAGAVTALFATAVAGSAKATAQTDAATTTAVIKGLRISELPLFSTFCDRPAADAGWRNGLEPHDNIGFVN
jgi:hypothetical protein